MNDPNGMFVDEDGLWHLYYQCEFSIAKENAPLSSQTTQRTSLPAISIGVTQPRLICTTGRTSPSPSTPLEKEPVSFQARQSSIPTTHLVTSPTRPTE